MSRHSDSVRERIIDAAEQVVAEFGTKHLTFNAVACKTGVSRGGLLYHFPHKEALLKGMLDRLVGRAKEGRMRKRAELPESKEREIVAHVLSLLEEDEIRQKGAAAALIAAGAHDPKFLAPIRENYRGLIDDLTNDAVGFERATVIMLAADGLRMLELLSIAPFDKEERRRIVEEMIFLAKEKKK